MATPKRDNAEGNQSLFGNMKFDKSLFSTKSKESDEPSGASEEGDTAESDKSLFGNMKFDKSLFGKKSKESDEPSGTSEEGDTAESDKSLFGNMKFDKSLFGSKKNKESGEAPEDTAKSDKSALSKKKGKESGKPGATGTEAEKAPGDETVEPSEDADKSFITKFIDKIRNKIKGVEEKPKEADDKKNNAKLNKLGGKEDIKDQKIITETTGTEGDPNKFNGKRLAKKIYDQFINTVKLTIIPFIALMIAMIVANEMIVYPVPIRVIFFIFTLLIVIFYPLASIVLPLFYIFKGGYSYYVNNMTDKPRRIMPTIYCLLPITTYQPTSRLGYFFLYPFTYPKSEAGAEELPKITEEYLNSLIDSFKDYDKVSKLPIFAGAIAKAKDFVTNINKLNKIKNENDEIDSQTDKVTSIPLNKIVNSKKEEFKNKTVSEV